VWLALTVFVDWFSKKEKELNKKNFKIRSKRLINNIEKKKHKEICETENN